MTDKLKNLIANLKHLPGVYLMHNADGTIIYVGKAKDLYKRVSQYFLRPQQGKVMKMVMEVDYFETIITANEKEALVLEMNLIHEHYPKYNILLKDGSHYPYIAMKKKGDPFLLIKRNNRDKNFDYFGPYPNSGAAYQIIGLLNKIFPIRKCKTLQSSPCIYYHLGQCLAPCINKIDDSTNEELRNNIKSFMNGHNENVEREIKNKMLTASEELKFEQADEYKKIYEAIEHLNAAQNVETKDKKDRDIFAYAQRNGYLALTVFSYHHGMLLGKQNFINEVFDDIEEEVSDLILQYYEKYPLPHEIIINNQTVLDRLKDFLDTSFLFAKQGKFHELVISANENANNALDEYFLSEKIDTNKIALLEELGQIINIKTPYHIELFDNSHLQGSSPVGAMVAFINGEPAKKLYRKFKIEHEEARDDLKSMEEVVYRHYKRLVDENKKMPDLILVDGSLNQLKAARLSLMRLNVDIPVYGLYKNDKHRTSGVIDINGGVYEINNRDLFFLLTRMQDEVHRFAISFHRERRSKAMTSTLLDDIPGLGQKRKEMIYRAFKDVDQLKHASLEELNQILPKDVANRLYSTLHENS